jgi:hypothetical protein
MKKVEVSGFVPLSHPVAIELPQAAISQFCQRWKIEEFYKISKNTEVIWQKNEVIVL